MGLEKYFFRCYFNLNTLKIRNFCLSVFCWFFFVCLFFSMFRILEYNIYDTYIPDRWILCMPVWHCRLTIAWRRKREATDILCTRWINYHRLCFLQSPPCAAYPIEIPDMRVCQFKSNKDIAYITEYSFSLSLLVGAYIVRPWLYW